MVTASTPYTVDAHFAGKDAVVRETYDRLLAAVRAFGPVEEDPKKTSIHLNRRTAFAGVATRKDALVLTIKAANDIADARIHKHEQASAHRWHLEIRIREPKELDRQVRAWLEESYELSA